jgi:type IV pilus assembly protein PilC
MLTVGEESGTVDIMMAKAASLYELDVKNMSERVDKLLEPVINLGLAVIVGGILIAVIVPMFSMYSLIGE